MENILERAFTLCEDGLIQAEGLLLPGEPTSIRPNPAPPPPLTPKPVATEQHEPPRGEFEPRTVPILQPPSGNLEGYLEEIERTAILRALESTRYNKTAAAEKLGISFRALRYRLKKLGLE